MRVTLTDFTEADEVAIINAHVGKRHVGGAVKNTEWFYDWSVFFLGGPVMKVHGEEKARAALTFYGGLLK